MLGKLPFDLVFLIRDPVTTVGNGSKSHSPITLILLYFVCVTLILVNFPVRSGFTIFVKPESYFIGA